MKKFVLIDGNSLMNRAFYATPLLTNSKGMSTNAILAFLNMFVKIINDIGPQYILVAFDRKEPTFRHKLYTDYKGTRKPAPKELIEQIMSIKDVLDGLGIARFEMPGIEADDIIGTVSKKYKDIETIIITGDKDSFQLVDETSKVYFTKRGITDIEIYDNQNFYEKTSLTPKQIIDLKALMGDSSDNIPGVLGVGEKTAKTLLATYSTVENVYEHIDEIKGKLQEKLILGRENSKLSKTLATINTAVEIGIELSDFEYIYPFKSSAKKILNELELRSILRKTEIFEEGQNEFVSGVSVQEIDCNENIMSIIKSNKIAVVIDDFVSFYDLQNTEYKFKTGQDLLSCFDKDDAIKSLIDIFLDPNKTIILYYKNQTKHILNSLGIYPVAKLVDVSIMKYLVGFSGKDEKLSDAIFNNGFNPNLPAYSLYKLYEQYSQKLTGSEKWLYEYIDNPLSDILFDMENAGFKIDKDALNSMGNRLRERLDYLTKKIYALSGKEFNINSSKQLAEVLFVDLGLKHGKKSKNGYSTSSEILEELSGENEIIDYIIEYRKQGKLLSTYIDGFKPLIDEKTGLVHTTFNQVHTSTGRLSSREPNLQNIPVRDDEGREVRRLFSARDNDHILIDADYSQIELRLLADFSGSKQLIDAFNQGEDIHALTASQVFGVKLSEVSKEMRSSAKAVNFGIIYGISDYGLATNLKISTKKAGEYIKKYFEMYPSIKEYMQNNVDFARKNGYAVTMFGRKRYIPEINSPNYNIRSFAERVAMNMPLQGSASDIIKIAMINTHKRLKDENLQSKIILQVHDELIVDALKSEQEKVKQILTREMENAVSLKVKLTVNVSVCQNWYDAK